MTSANVPEEYMDVLLQEFAYDPIRLSHAEDPVQMLYNRRTLETIWVSTREAVNPYTRLPFDINNAIPQSELRQEMSQYISENRIQGLKVIPDYTKILTVTEMNYLLNDLVFHYHGSFSHITEKKEEDWTVLWQKLNLIRLYCQYREQNKNSFLFIKGYKYLFKVIDMHLFHSLWNCYHSSDDAKEVCRELVRIVDIIGLRQCQLETIPGNSLTPFVYILSNLADSSYSKIESLVLNIYSQIFYYGMSYALQNNECFHACVIADVLKLLGREDARDITNEDLDKGTAVLRAAWLCQRNALIDFDNYVDVVVDVVILCISRFRDNVAVASPGSRTSVTIGKALSRGLKLIQYIATYDGDYGIYDYEKDRLVRLDVVKHLVQMVGLVVAGFEFTPFHVELGLNIMTAICKSTSFEFWKIFLEARLSINTVHM